MTTKTHRRIRVTDVAGIASIIEKGEGFVCHGAVSGEPVEPGGYVNTGLLPGDYVSDLRAADYVVFSYATPIAWRAASSGEWTIPGLRYSITTSRHQNVIHRVVAIL